MESLKNMHQQILHNVEMVQDRSSKILQEQERDLLRAFRARLFDVQVGLESVSSNRVCVRARGGARRAIMDRHKCQFAEKQCD